MLSQTKIKADFFIATPEQWQERLVEDGEFKTSRSYDLYLLEQRMRSASASGDLQLLHQLEVKLQDLIDPTGAHHRQGESRVEFTSDNLPTPESIEIYLTVALQKSIENDLPVAILGSPTTSRSIQIGTFSAVPCGGTHLQNLGQLELVEITRVKIKKGKL
jgi:hypothetical protein